MYKINVHLQHGYTFSMVSRPIWTLAILGFGEAGAEIAAGLSAAGAQVRGYDPVAPAPPGVAAAASDLDACTGADLVLSLTTAAEAEAALRQSLSGCAGATVYADANTASAGQKECLAAIAADAGLRFADIAIMAPVPGLGHRVPMIASGSGAQRTSQILLDCGASIDVLPGPAGQAATRKLLRSVFYKGMAAAAIEALLAARSAGCEDWLREHLCEELAAADTGTLARLETGSYRHALRRSHEMAAATELLKELGVPPWTAAASRQWLEDLARQPREAQRPELTDP
jgi:3-hydroxyisobutyrate dehydrogenase-like beta-hydroxyacid dehydrogenase